MSKTTVMPITASNAGVTAIDLRAATNSSTAQQIAAVTVGITQTIDVEPAQ